MPGPFLLRRGREIFPVVGPQLLYLLVLKKLFILWTINYYLQKYDVNGFQNQAFNWFESYLTDQQQFTFVVW